MQRTARGDVVYDLGCGDGRIVVTAAKRYGARAVGFDIDPERVAEAEENVRRAGVEDLASIRQADVFTLDLTPATVVTMYLLPRLNLKLVPQLEKLAPGTRTRRFFGLSSLNRRWRGREGDVPGPYSDRTGAVACPTLRARLHGCGEWPLWGWRSCRSP